MLHDPVSIPEELSNQVLNDWVIELKLTTEMLNALHHKNSSLLDSWCSQFKKISTHFPSFIINDNFKEWLIESLPFHHVDLNKTWKLTEFYSEICRNYKVEDVIRILNKNQDHIRLIKYIDHEMQDDPILICWMELVK